MVDVKKLESIIKELENILKANKEVKITTRGVESFIKIDLSRIKKSTDGKYLIGYLNGLNDLRGALLGENIEILIPRLESVRNEVQAHLDKLAEEERKPKGYDRIKATAKVNLPRPMTKKEMNKRIKETKKR